MRHAAAGAGTGLYDLEACDGRESTGTRLVDGCDRPAGGNELRATPKGDSPNRESALHPFVGSAQLPQSIDPTVGGLLPEAEGPTLMDEEEALREYGLRSLGGDSEVWDDISGEPLPAAAVRTARAEEVAFMEEWGCWTRAPYEEAVTCGGRKPIATRWVDVNKGDAASPDVRSRLVAKDFAGQRDDSFFAATPPLEALRMLISDMMSGSSAVQRR